MMTRAEICKAAAIARWAKITDPEARREALRPAFSITPGRPRKARANKVHGRDSLGRFLPRKSQQAA